MKIDLKFLRDWALSLTTLVGAVSGFAAFLPGISLTVPRSLVILTGCLVISAAFAWQRTTIRQFPADEVFGTEDDIHCRLECPASRAHAVEAGKLAANAYGSGVGGIPADRYDSWRVKNPHILACLINSNGALVGYFDILPLRSEFMERFIRGELTEHDIRHEDILPPNQVRRCKRLYLAGIAVRDPHTFAARRQFRHLMWALVKYIQHYYGLPSERQLFALASTKEGKNLLDRFHFNVIQGGATRRDGQSLYVASLADSDLSRKADADIGEWSQGCSLSWEDVKRTGARHRNPAS